MIFLDRLLAGIEAWHARRVAADRSRFTECRAPGCRTVVDRHSRGFQIHSGCCSPGCREHYRSYLPTPWLLRS